MITKHSIDLTMITEPCFAITAHDKGCGLLRAREPGCCTWRCPFYKPMNCKQWVRIEDRQGINLVPPEEAYGRG